MRVALDVTGTKDKASTKLKWILTKAVLLMARRPCPLPGNCIVVA